MQIEEIYKRNHLKKPFLTEKITEAVLKAMRSVGEGSDEEAEKISTVQDAVDYIDSAS